MIIEKITVENYDEMYSLWLSCKGMGLNGTDDSREGIGRFLDRNPDTCFGAFENGRLIGVILAGNDGRRGFIYHTAVSPDCRKKGVGAALVSAALGALKKLGITKTALVVFNRNEDGNAFWEKQGFSRRDDLVYRNKPLAETERIDT